MTALWCVWKSSAIKLLQHEALRQEYAMHAAEPTMALPQCQTELQEILFVLSFKIRFMRGTSAFKTHCIDYVEGSVYLWYDGDFGARWNLKVLLVRVKGWAGIQQKLRHAVSLFELPRCPWKLLVVCTVVWTYTKVHRNFEAIRH